MIVKVCGMTREEDVRFCDALGVDLLGFIFHAGSPRNVAARWVAGQRPGRALKVGVFVRQGVDEIAALADEAGLDLLQLHGGHTVEQCRVLGPERVIKTLWPERYPAPELLRADMEMFAPVCRAILLDSGTSGGEEDLVRARAVQRAIRGLWRDMSPERTGYALVSLKIMEDGSIGESVVNRVSGDAEFQSFLLSFLAELKSVYGNSGGPGGELWIECEFVIQPMARKGGS